MVVIWELYNTTADDVLFQIGFLIVAGLISGFVYLIKGDQK